ncbi:hypothetical protein VP01_430g3 [Puccinia sorghi]|uniref:Uncharacterized protein n=1 Tax=Puccinia sorghi TaxID=27349 RepID=A0A0L6UQ39_9BASI|nr:hypothetical protein VP01_430g3 [Puccinia sorghi]
MVGPPTSETQPPPSSLTTPGDQEQSATMENEKPLFRLAFASLILKKDRVSWNGANTASNVSAQDTSLPTEVKILAEMKTLTAKEKEQLEVEEGALTSK